MSISGYLHCYFDNERYIYCDVNHDDTVINATAKCRDCENHSLIEHNVIWCKPAHIKICEKYVRESKAILLYINSMAIPYGDFDDLDDIFYREYAYIEIEDEEFKKQYINDVEEMGKNYLCARQCYNASDDKLCERLLYFRKTKDAFAGMLMNYAQNKKKFVKLYFKGFACNHYFECKFTQTSKDVYACIFTGNVLTVNKEIKLRNMKVMLYADDHEHLPMLLEYLDIVPLSNDWC